MSPNKFFVTFNPVHYFQNTYMRVRECILYVSELNIILYYFCLIFFLCQAHIFLTKNLV